MATAYTTLLGLALPVTGELQGTWGTTVNDAITSLLDTAVAGTTTLNTDADVTLSTTTGAANQARQAIILWTANGTITRNITAPAQSKAYIVINNSAGTQSIVIRGVGPTTGVTVAKGERVVVAWNGSDFVRVSAYGGTGEFTTVDTTNLEVTNIKAKDGTAAATIADSTGAFSVSAAFAANGNVTLGDASGDAVTVNGTSTFTAKPTVQLTSAATNTVTQVMRLDSQSSGTPAAGIGVGLEFAAETAAGNTEVGATLEAITTDVTAASEDFDLSVKLMINGAAAAEVARFKSTGLSLATGDTYQINNTDVLSATTLGSGVTGSSLTSVGTIGTGTWQGTVINSTYGGTGINNGGRTLTINTNSGTLAFGAASKTLTINNSLTLAGTDATTMTFPAASTTVAGLGTTQTFTGVNTFTPTARTSGVASYFTLTTPADTGQTASTESIGASFTAATRTWATGALTLQRERVFAAPTYAFAGASTLTTAVNVDIAAPVAGTNATITNSYALRAAATQFTGTVNATGLTASQAIFTDANKNFVSNAITGSGNVVMSASPTLTGTVAGASLQLSSLTSGRVTYAGASGLLQDSANLTFNGTDLTVSGAVNAGTVNATTFDMTNLEVTNIKAKDGTASASIADTTGAFSVSAAFAANGNSTLGDAVGDTVTINGTTTFVNAAPTLTPLTASQAVFTNGSKTLVSNAITGTGNVVMSTSPSLTTPSLGAATATSINKVTITAPATSATLTIADGKTLTVNNSLTLAGTDATTMTFPAASTTVAGLGTTQTFTGVNTFTPAARTSGVAAYFTLTTPADTGQTASTESIGASFTAATRTWATGALTLQRERVFAAPTYAFAGASTLTTAVNVDIAAPVAGANATITNAYALRAAATQFTGAINATGLTASQAIFTDANKNFVSNAITGTGSVVMSASPTLTGTITAAAANFSGAVALNGNSTLGDAVGDTVTINGTTTFVNAAPTLTPLTASQAVFTNGSKTLVSNAITGTGNVVMSASPTLTGTITAAGATFSGAVTMSTATDNIAIGTSQTTGTWTAGGAAQTGTITLDQSTKAHTLNIGTGATENATTKTINIGTAGVSGSTTNLTYGSGVTGSTTTHIWNSGGTEGMRLNSTGLGIGTSSPGAKLEVASGKVLLSNTQSYAIKTSAGASCDVVTLTSGNVLQLGGGGATNSIEFWNQGLQRMTLDSSGNLGIGISSPQAVLHVNKATSSTFRLSATNVGIDIQSLDSAGYGLVATYTNHPMVFSTNATERMRLDASGNLGIGTSSPSAKLHVAGTFRQNDATSTYGYTVTTASSKTVTAALFGGGYFAWQTNNSGTDQLILDTSGNLGLGVTPSAWGTTAQTAIQLAATGALSSRAAGNTDSAVTHGAYYDGTNWRYIASSIGAARYQMTGANAGSTHSWSVSAGGTAGNAISFTQAMTLTATGRLNLTPGTGANAYIECAAGTNTAGTNSALYGQDANNFAYCWNRANEALLFGTNNAERARITSGGEVVVNETAAVAGAAFSSNAFSGTAAAGFKSNASTVYAIVTIWGNETSGNQIFTRFATDANQERGTIAYNRAGGLVAYNTTSDYRAKDIIGPVQNAGATIDALKVYEGVMKGATQSRPMLIAHEAQEHAPYAVSGIKDEVNEDGTPKFQQMDVSSLVPLLLAEIQSLRARVAALESQP